MTETAEVQLFAINTKELTIDFYYSDVTNYLPINEIEKIGKKKKHKDLLNSLIGYLIITGYLCKYAGVRRERIEFHRNQWGKPFLKNDLKWKGSFNISHSNDWVICGISNSQIIGVDIEKKNSHEHLFFKLLFY
ncbi:hypothetical protein [Neobacillus sp. OS1-33]|uniref:4'-phosphopantetheinyl transferase family protein n=1 Tax=Neobacillus sp. OS1-33 TaxID=3070683 RepID=UPI0027E018C6|nr:hypothetical protein [Neobacillus sp. OS1-33]WML26144.1 hypothetical protein RCG22_00395 [Neobacillus sp. OS1-33]